MQTKIEEDTYYISDWEEFVSLCNYTKVWEDGFECNVYIIKDCSIDFEAQGWDGFDPVVNEKEREINSELYYKWEQEIEDAKRAIKKIGYEAKSSVVKKLKAGDYIFDIESFEEENDYSCSFLKIVHASKSSVKAKPIFVGRLGVDYSKEPIEMDKIEYDFLSDKYLAEGLIFNVSEKAFYQVVEIIRQLSNKIMSEIKAQVKGEKITKL